MFWHALSFLRGDEQVVVGPKLFARTKRREEKWRNKLRGSHVSSWTVKYLGLGFWSRDKRHSVEKPEPQILDENHCEELRGPLIARLRNAPRKMTRTRSPVNPFEDSRTDLSRSPRRNVEGFWSVALNSNPFQFVLKSSPLSAIFTSIYLEFFLETWNRNSYL